MNRGVPVKIGLSSYSLLQALKTNELDILSAIDWIKENGGEHIEIVPMGFDLVDNPELIDQIRNKALQVGIEISNYAIYANFIQPSIEGVENEIERVKQHVDIAHRLGVKYMRHDVAFRDETSIQQFEKDLPTLVEACRKIADYAAQYNITTNVENHGFYVQSSDRVQRLVHEVNRPNFQTILDVGNFLCVDENPVKGVKNNLSIASVVHFKDFYYRPSGEDPGEGFFQTSNGNYLRGAIVGQGDINLRQIIKLIKESGFDGYVSIEFEGLEDCRLGSRVGLTNVKRLLEKCT